jgi:hypothetical protein
MTVTVLRISVPAMSSIGFGSGVNENGDHVEFAGDHRAMRNIGEAMQYTTSNEPIVVELEDWQILAKGA